MYSADINNSFSVFDIPRFSNTGFLILPTSLRRAKFCMLRAPIWSMSAYSATSVTSVGVMTSVTNGIPVFSRASARSFRPSSSRPWKLYGEVRGLNAPPRSTCAPAFFTTSALFRICSRVSTEHGPAMTTNCKPPIEYLPTLTTVFSFRISLLASLNGLRIGITLSTPGATSRDCNWVLLRSSPTHPITVRSVPTIGCAWKPYSFIFSMTWLNSAFVAPGFITIIIQLFVYLCWISINDFDLHTNVTSHSWANENSGCRRVLSSSLR